ncbi:hypothetical protein [Bacillus niameyensis]|uniref:hypothetical protein n=1 Tax=Bacillus niameyensis TaxID=1522308 RepID=UPI0007829790|nr:hypothetical protein [Bacillus niameyensis]
MEQRLLEKKKYTFEELSERISERGTLFLQDLLKTDINGRLYTLFINHTLVLRDVEELSLISYEDKNYIHGIVDVYDRVLREKLYNSSNTRIENDQIADIVIRSNIVINVLELGVANFIQQGPEESIALPNKYLIEIYTDWHTQMHHKDQEFFHLFFE